MFILLVLARLNLWIDKVAPLASLDRAFKLMGNFLLNDSG